MADRTLRVEIIGDASSLQKTFGKAADSGDNFGRTLGRVGKAAGVAVGAAALGGIALTLKAGISEWTESTKVIAQTQAVIKSTGGAAGVSAKEVDTLAESIRRKTGVDDEAIASGENLLLTFTNIRNETGKGNDIFTRATKTIVDMSVALGQDTKSSAIQLGKALNDPIKGVTALQRVGVSFTAGQKEQIKALTSSGKSMQAQKLILGELNKEFGGSAEAAGKTLPGQLNILKGSFENLAGNLVGKAAPALTKFVGFLNEKGVPAIGQAFGKISEVAGPALSKLFDTFKSAIPVILGVVTPLVQEIGSRLIPIFQSLAEIGGKAIAAIGDVIKSNGPQLRQIFENLSTVISNLAKIVLPILEIAFTKVLPVALRVLIPVLVVTTTALAKLSDIARVVAQVVAAVLGAAIRFLVPIVTTMAGAFTSAWGKVSAAVKTAVAFVMPLINGIKAIVTGMVDAVVGVLTGDWGRAWSGIKQVVTTAINGVKTFLQSVPGAILSLGVAIGKAIIDGIVSGFTGLLGHLKSSLESGLKSVVSSLNPFSPVEEGGARYIGRPLAEGAIRGWIQGSAGLPKALSDKIREAVESARSAIQASEGVLSSAMGALADAMMSAFDKVTDEHLTKSEKTLLKRQEELAKKQRQQALADANAAVDTAQGQLAAATTPEEVAAATDALKAAYEQQAQALYDIETARLERQAEQERRAYEKKRERQRINLEDDLAAAQAAYNRGAINLETYNQRVMAIMKKYEIPWRKSANALGISLAHGLHEAFDDVQKAAKALAQEIFKQLSQIKVIVQVNLSTGSTDERNAKKRQHGGPVRAGEPYIIGEVGPELFIPGMSGKVVPSGAAMRMAGGGGTEVTLNFYGTTVGTSREFQDIIRQALYDVQRRNPGTGL